MDQNVIKALVVFIENNGVADDVRICLQNDQISSPTRFIASIIELLTATETANSVLDKLTEKLAKREKMPFELHYQDGYRSWYLEDRIKTVDAFYCGNYLVSINSTAAVGFYDETVAKAKKHRINGQPCQLLPSEVYFDNILPQLQKVNKLLNKLGGDFFWGNDWYQAEDQHDVGYINIDKKQLVSATGTVGTFLGRPAVKAE